MNRFLRSTDLDAWSRERALGFGRFVWTKSWPTGVGFATGNVLIPWLGAGRHFDWKDTALWFGWGLVCGFFWATVTWWNRERAFRNASGGRSGAAD